MQPTFPLFSNLPPNLRLRVWQLAMEEPTKVTVSVSRYAPPHGPRPSIGVLTQLAVEGNIGTPSAFRASASFPPLMLASRESHALASAHYRRAFASACGKGGVLAAYPTVLHVDDDAAGLLRAGDLELVRDVHVRYASGVLTSYPQGHLQTIIEAPRLELLSFATCTPWAYGIEKSFCILFRRFCLEVTSRNPKCKIPEIEINVEARDGGKPYYFRGSWRDMPYGDYQPGQ
ncbi:hypothetical protein F4825DRAFT_212067 [Nemania diffusa]|nr:hypothetical protein F4825DRAFT_212067 [Nemania diffusa]